MKKIIITITIASTVLCAQNSFGMLIKKLSNSNLKNTRNYSIRRLKKNNKYKQDAKEMQDIFKKDIELANDLTNILQKKKKENLKRAGLIALVGGTFSGLFFANAISPTEIEGVVELSYSLSILDNTCIYRDDFLF